jgi:hypothetical protein
MIRVVRDISYSWNPGSGDVLSTRGSGVIKNTYRPKSPSSFKPLGNLVLVLERLSR